MADMNMHNSFVSICIFVVVFGVLQYVTGPSSPIRSRSLPISTVIPFGRIPQTIDDSACTLAEVKVPVHRVHPTFLPSYPGSGTKLQWEIVEALTGIPTTDDQFSNGHHNVAGIKTHYPCLAGKEFPGAEEIRKAVIFVRHPMDALPAYFNMIHASESEAGYDPQNIPIAPMDAWVEWRDHSFTRELDTWRKHLEYWADRYKSSDRLVIPYERFIDPVFGPELTGNIAEFLSRSEGITTVSAEEVPCIWHKVVTKELAAEAAARGDSLGEVKPDGKASRPSGEDNPDGKEHLRRRLQMVPPQQQQSGISQQNQIQQPSLSQSTTQWSQSHVGNTGPKQDDVRKSMDSGVSMNKIDHSQRDTGMQQHTESNGMQQSNTQPQMQKQHHGERVEPRDATGSAPNAVGLVVDAASNAVGQPVDVRSPSLSDSVQLSQHGQSQTQNQQSIQYHEKTQEIGSGGGDLPSSNTDLLHDSNQQDAVKVHAKSEQQGNIHMVSDVAKPIDTTVEKAGESISVLMSKVQQTKVLQDELSGQDKVTIAEVKGVDKAVVKKTGESISQLINRVQQTKDRDEQLTQKEDTSEMMDEPSGRRYTGEQRKDIVVMLAQLLEKYGTDRVLTPLMVNYIDAVERRVKLSKGPKEYDTPDSPKTMGL